MLLWASTTPLQPKNLLATTGTLLQTWRQTTPRLLKENDLLLEAPLQALAAHTSNLQLENWLSRGISGVRSLLTQEGIKPFPDMVRDFHIPSRELFTYLRLKNIIQESRIILKETNLISPFVHKCTGKLPKVKALSLCYNTLLTQYTATKPSYMTNWELDLGLHFPVDMWHRAQKLTKQASHSLNQWETYCKLTMRWYLVPNKLAHIYPGANKICWRCHNQEGSLYHIFWKCTQITSLWQDIHTLFCKNLGIGVPPTPECFLLHIFPDNLHEDESYLMIHCLMATKTAIAQKWKSTQAPTLSEILGRLDSIYNYERMASRITERQSRHETRWRRWVDYRY
ncbi:Hypothetical predicted protein, partial [Pelobates cultripes]